jgi:hypothetical protein
MEQIREAIIGFAQANGRLPCPANGALASGAAGAGTEQAPGGSGNEDCGANTFGVVPWATLGVPETDSWGRRFSYWVSPAFADGINLPSYGAGCTPAPIPPSSFALCTLGTLTVNTRSGAAPHSATAIGAVLPAVIISHGKKGAGAFSPAGTTLTAPTGADEIANATHTAAATIFYSRPQTPRASPCNEDAGPPCEFDDIVVMITSNVLVARMIAAGRLP